MDQHPRCIIASLRIHAFTELLPIRYTAAAAAATTACTCPSQHSRSIIGPANIALTPHVDGQTLSTALEHRKRCFESTLCNGKYMNLLRASSQSTNYRCYCTSAACQQSAVYSSASRGRVSLFVV